MNIITVKLSELKTVINALETNVNLKFCCASISISIVQEISEDGKSVESIIKFYQPTLDDYPTICFSITEMED